MTDTTPVTLPPFLLSSAPFFSLPPIPPPPSRLLLFLLLLLLLLLRASCCSRRVLGHCCRSRPSFSAFLLQPPPPRTHARCQIRRTTCPLACPCRLPVAHSSRCTKMSSAAFSDVTSCSSQHVRECERASIKCVIQALGSFHGLRCALLPVLCNVKMGVPPTLDLSSALSSREVLSPSSLHHHRRALIHNNVAFGP